MNGISYLTLTWATDEPGLVDTIATLQGALNEKDKTIKLLEEKVKRLETELAMVKNERKIG